MIELINLFCLFWYWKFGKFLVIIVIVVKLGLVIISNNKVRDFYIVDKLNL